MISNRYGKIATQSNSFNYYLLPAFKVVVIIANKTIRITVRLTEQQYEKIKANAEMLNMKISSYVAKCSSEKEIIVIEDFKQFIHLLLKIGNNLNQAVMLCHEGKITCLDISSTKNLLIEILQTVTSTKIKKAIHKGS